MRARVLTFCLFMVGALRQGGELRVCAAGGRGARLVHDWRWEALWWLYEDRSCSFSTTPLHPSVHPSLHPSSPRHASSPSIHPSIQTQLSRQNIFLRAKPQGNARELWTRKKRVCCWQLVDLLFNMSCLFWFTDRQYNNLQGSFFPPLFLIP